MSFIERSAELWSDVNLLKGFSKLTKQEITIFLTLYFTKTSDAYMGGKGQVDFCNNG
jgi:hypothetical protein